MKNKVILLVVGLAMVALLAVATLFYEDLSAQFGADPITPTQQAPQEDQNTASGEQEKQPVAAPDFTVEDANGNTLRNGLPLLSELNFPTLNVGANTVTVAVSDNTVTFTELEISARSRWR